MSDNEAADIRPQVIRTIGKVAQSLIKWGGIALIFYYSFRTIKVLAGERTYADINLVGDFAAKLGLGTAIWWIVFAFLLIWALVERNLRKSLETRLNSTGS